MMSRNTIVKLRQLSAEHKYNRPVASDCRTVFASPEKAPIKKSHKK